MNVTAVAVVGIIFGTIYAVMSLIFKFVKESKAHKQVDESLTKDIESLKERVATLEKIVTDEKYQLKKEFDSLK